MSIRILLVDDTRMFRDGLQAYLATEPDMSVAGVAGDGAEGLAVARRERPDVVLMDVRMPVMDGVEATRQLRQELPDTQVIMLTTYTDDEFLFEALKAGAVGYLIKDMPAAKLIEAIRTVTEGGALISPAVALRLVQEFTRLAASASTPVAPRPGAAPTVETPAAIATQAVENPRVADLSNREREILRMLAEGLSNKEIAARIFLSEGTVKNYVSTIFAKLHARHRAQAISMALRQGLLD